MYEYLGVNSDVEENGPATWKGGPALSAPETGAGETLDELIHVLLPAGELRALAGPPAPPAPSS